MKPKYKLLAAACALLMAGGCSDSDDWTPGAQDTETGVSAYFEKPSQTSFTFDKAGSADDMKITVEVSRQVTEGAVSIPITLTSDADGFSAPAAVDFATGQATSSFDVMCAGIPDGKQVKLTVTLDPAQTNVYGEGLYAVEYSVIKADWIEIADNVRYLYSDFSGNSLYPSTYSKMYQLEGTYQFKLLDFFGSGLEMIFECKQPTGTQLVPMINADFENVYEDDKADGGWYLYNEAEQTWPSWTPGDAEGYTGISYCTFYTISDYNVCNMIYNQETLYGYVGLTAALDLDDASFVWGNFQIDFNLKYNPFE